MAKVGSEWLGPPLPLSLPPSGFPQVPETEVLVEAGGEEEVGLEGGREGGKGGKGGRGEREGRMWWVISCCFEM